MVAHFRLLTLGAPLLLSAGGEVVRYRTRKHFALLVRLALEPGRKLAREYLIDLLWRDVPLARGRHSLSQAISVLRGTLGPHSVVAQRTFVAIVPGVVEVDVLELERNGTEIRGRFLEGFAVRGARGFDEWRERWEARLQPQLRDCLVKRMDAGRRIGDFETVERYALVLEDLDPESEDAVRGIMEARAWVGDRSGALQAFARFARRVNEGGGSPPSTQLERIAELLRAGRRAAPRPSADGVPPREERRFEAESIIGRQREFSVLYDAWLEVRRRVPRVMVLLGDPGIGKTTLTNAFASSCQMEGGVIARTQAYDAERELPYAVLAELVRQLALQRCIGAAEPEALAELSRLVPEILTVFPGVPQSVDWPPEVVPLRLADAFLKAVTAAADENPVLLVVDDVHAADNASIAILHMLARKLVGLRLMIILAGRSFELRFWTYPQTLVSDPSIRGLGMITLEPLSVESSTALVHRIKENLNRGEEPPVGKILRLGAGNPLAIELLTCEWNAKGSESLLKQLDRIDTMPEPFVGIPTAIGLVYETQVKRLDAATRSTLDLAAILGRRLAESELYQVIGFRTVEASRRLADLLEVGLLREIRGGLEFRNELIRAKAYYGLPSSYRKNLHIQVAKRLGNISPERPAVALEIAWHFLRGEEPRMALPHALRGAYYSIKSGAPTEAEHILTVLAKSDLSIAEKKEIRLGLAEALLALSNGQAACSVLDDLEASEVQLTPKEYADAALARATAEYLLNRDTSRPYADAARAALAAARATSDPRTITRALLEAARAGEEIGDEETVKNVYAEVKRLMVSGQYTSLCLLYYTRAYCETWLLRVNEARKHMSVALSYATNSSDLAVISRILSGLGVIEYFQCDMRAARTAFEKALELAQKIGDWSRSATIAANLCNLLTMTGQYRDAIAAGRKAVEWGSRALTQPFLSGVYMNLVEPYLLTGNSRDALNCIQEAQEWAAGHGSWFSQIAILEELGSYCMMTDDREAAIRIASDLDDAIHGREDICPIPGTVIKLRGYRAFLQQDYDSALRLSTSACENLRDRCTLVYLDALAVKAKIEKHLFGDHRHETTRDLGLYEELGVAGKKAQLVAQGFLDPQPTA